MNDSINRQHTADTATVDAPFTEESSLLSPYDSVPVSSDQRRSYRYPAQPGQDVATVRAGRTTLKAKLCEESADGLAVQVTGKCQLKVNDEVEVGIYTGWYRSRVVHVQPIDGGHRIGLQRISIIAPEEDKARGNGKSKPPGQVRNLVAVAFVAMAVGVGVTNFIGGQFDKSKPDARIGVPVHFADDSNGELKGVLDGVNILLEPSVAQRLKLTDTQQESIEGVLIGASNSLAKAHNDSRDKDPAVWYQESQSIMNKAIENILCGLTDEQVLKWRAVVLYRRNAE